MTAPPSCPRRLRVFGKLTGSLIAFALALAGTAVATGTSHAEDQHPASAGWVRTHGSWEQIQPGRPHAAADALTTLNARSAATVTQHPTHPMGLVNNDQPDLTYHGGQDSVGVTPGSPKVYIWSGVMTQYCESTAKGSTKCDANSPHVGVPHGNALAGIWVDNSTAAPQAATEPQIAAEAAAAAKHFGNTTPASNRNVQYVVTTAQGMDPDHWHELNTWCAWHTFERSSYGTVAYTLMPYLTDYKYCGTNWINPGPRGRLDGWSILGGHEYAETITDQNAIGGWIDAAGQEDGDKCAWIQQGTPGGLFNLQLATGSFAVQTTWSNDQHTCSGSHPVIANRPLVVSTLCDRTEPVNRPVSVPVIATDRLSKALRYSATGLPRGLSIDARTGLIHGRSDQRGTRTVTVTVQDKAGNRAATHFRLGILHSAEYGCQGIEQIVDPGFEVPTDAKGNYPGWWTQSAPGIITQSTTHTARSGKGYAWLGHTATQDDTLSQSVETTPGYTRARFSFWLHVDSTNASAQPQDTLTLELDDQYSGKRIAVLHTWSNHDATAGYVPVSIDLTPYVASEFGSTVIVKFTAHETGSAATAFLLDDTSFRLA
jgi:hypothetical protein